MGVAKVGESRVTNAYKTLNEELGLPAKPSTPTMYIPRLASDLDCPERIRRRARALAEAAGDVDVTSGVHPAACLYKAGQEQGQWVTQRAVAEAGNVTPTTVRAHYETVAEQVA